MVVRPEFQAEQGTHAAGTRQLVLERHEEVTVTVDRLKFHPMTWKDGGATSRSGGLDPP